VALAITPRFAVAEDATAQARKYFQSASKHFDLGEYREALEDFKSGYRLKDDPIFLYNIGQCERLLGHNVEAIRSYKAYLRRKPDAPNRGEVQKKVDALEQAQRSQERASSTPPNQVLESEHGGEPGTEHATPPPTTPTPESTPNAPTATQTPEQNQALTQTAAPRKTPIYKKWWLWTIVGVAAVGIAVGTGVGVAESSKSSTPFFPAVQF
jgi:tetratricopeptide (TPR) repeat protein